MPKNKRKVGKGSAKNRANENSGSDDEGSISDNMSVVSMAGSEVSGINADDQGVDESSKEELYENKLKDAMELATQKSASVRVKAIQSLCIALMNRYSSDFVEDRRMTFTDLVEKGLKKGKGDEVVAVSRLAILVAVQLDDCEEVYKDLRALMVQIVNDGSYSAAARGAVATTLGGLCYMGGGEMAEVVTTMSILESIFSQSLIKKDGSASSFGPEMLSFHTECLTAWSLLFTVLSPSQAYTKVNSYVKMMSGLFNANDVDLRMAAGEATALVLETAYEYDESFEPEGFDELLASLKGMATEHSKSKSKKDRKEQRSCFRDILKGVEEGDPPIDNVKFGRESLELNSWYRKVQYDWFCKVMGPGINYHLACNNMLRDFLDLGPPLLIVNGDSMSKPSKTERNAANQMASKYRSQTRGKNRDKRSAVV